MHRGELAHDDPQAHDHLHLNEPAPEEVRGHEHPHAHGHGLIDDSIKRSRAGLHAVGLSLLVLGLTALGQAAIYLFSGSIALLADLIHNFGDALTALPLGIALALRSAVAERRAGMAVVLAIFVSACVAGFEAVQRLDAVVSLGVVASALVVALGLPIADPLIGLGITIVMLRITWQSWLTVRPGAD